MSGTSNKLGLRMYHLTMYNLSGIQKGIQSYHAGIEYLLKYPKDKLFMEWARNHKTVYILNGGTSNEGVVDYIDKKIKKTHLLSKGSMELHEEQLKKIGIKYAKFNEPDLNWSLSGIAFLVDERVFDKKKYPDYDINELVLNPPTYNKWLKLIGGKQNAELREFLKPFKLA